MSERLTEMAEVKRLLLEHYTPAEAFEWLFAPHPQLNDIEPVEVIAVGHGHSVLAILHRLDSGHIYD